MQEEIQENHILIEGVKNNYLKVVLRWDYRTYYRSSHRPHRPNLRPRRGRVSSAVSLASAQSGWWHLHRLYRQRLRQHSRV